MRHLWRLFFKKRRSAVKSLDHAGHFALENNGNEMAAVIRQFLDKKIKIKA